MLIEIPYFTTQIPIEWKEVHYVNTPFIKIGVTIIYSLGVDMFIYIVVLVKVDRQAQAICVEDEIEVRIFTFES